MRYEHLPPSPAYVRYWNRVFVFGLCIPKVWDETEDFERDPVDWGEAVLQGPNEAENFESVLLEDIDLKGDTS